MVSFDVVEAFAFGPALVVDTLKLSRAAFCSSTNRFLFFKSSIVSTSFVYSCLSAEPDESAIASPPDCSYPHSLNIMTNTRTGFISIGLGIREGGYISFFPSNSPYL